MLVIVCCPCAKFERNRLRHVREMALDMKKSQQNGRLTAILDLIAKPIDVHMSTIVYYPCAKFERNRARHV